MRIHSSGVVTSSGNKFQPGLGMCNMEMRKRWCVGWRHYAHICLQEWRASSCMTSWRSTCPWPSVSPFRGNISMILKARKTLHNWDGSFVWVTIRFECKTWRFISSYLGYKANFAGEPIWSLFLEIICAHQSPIKSKHLSLPLKSCQNISHGKGQCHKLLYFLWTVLGILIKIFWIRLVNYRIRNLTFKKLRN